MKLQSKNKVSADFNMSSMTDIIFLLLIFFVLTSNPAVQKALDLKLPSSDNSNSTQDPVSVSITKDGIFYVGATNIPKESLEGAIKNQLAGVAEPSFVIRAEDQSMVQELVYVMSIANRNKYKVVLATAPKE